MGNAFALFIISYIAFLFVMDGYKFIIFQYFKGLKKENVVMFDNKKMLGYVHCSRNLNMFVHLLRKNIENKTNMTRDFYLEFEQYLS